MSRYNFCTLFDSYYLDKGFALYRSLMRVEEDFQLFIFCFDDKTYEIFQQEQLRHVVPIHHSAIEDETLLRLKEERSKPEYCWTCTPVIIEYVLDNYQVDSCTYIDADMYFFRSPKEAYDEIEDGSFDIAIVEHRFPDTSWGRKWKKKSGRFCVEFNYFNQSEHARNALRWWKEQCYEWCYYRYEENRMGDQKYLEQFPQLFDGVCILQHLGVGTAPWNLSQYHLDNQEDLCIQLAEQNSGQKFSLILYHFQGIRFVSDDMVNISSNTPSKELKYAIYIPYLKEIVSCRAYLKRYGIDFQKNFSKTNNPMISFLQKYIRRFKVRYLSDLISIDRLAENER